jgi:hypothetical protein
MGDDLSSAGSSGDRRAMIRMLLFALMIPVVVLTVAAWPWGRQPGPESVRRSSGDPSSSLGNGEGQLAKYIGEAACMECHPGESAQHSRSGHDRTLQPAKGGPVIAWLNGKSVNDPKLTDVRWSYHTHDDQLVVDRTAGGQAESLVLDYAVGSGKHGVTFVAILGDEVKPAPSGIEHRLSYVAHKPALVITPGQEEVKPVRSPREGAESGAFGLRMGPDHLRECINCHATYIPPAPRYRPENTNVIASVSCERCHGPGRDHVDAARRGETNLHMPMGSDRVEPWVEVNMCGECHRLPKSVSQSWIRPNNPRIVRFQGVGLSMSACYAKGLGGLRCTTCHDPHERASSDQTHYETACLSCHRSAPAQKPCPVSPAANCVECHMPRREIRGNGIFTDHWIRKPDSTSPSAPKSEAARTSSNFKAHTAESRVHPLR